MVSSNYTFQSGRNKVYVCLEYIQYNNRIKIINNILSLRNLFRIHFGFVLGVKTAVVSDARKDTYSRQVLRHDVSGEN